MSRQNIPKKPVSVKNKKRTSPFALIFPILALALLIGFCFFASRCWRGKREPLPIEKTATFVGGKNEKGEMLFNEAFGVAVDKSGYVYVSDGGNGKIFIAYSNGTTKLLTDKLDTPSQMAVDSTGNIIVADSGSHTIKKVTSSGETSTIAGIEGKRGASDGDTKTALLNAPIGVAIGEKGEIFVSDTYNDRICVIENDKVRVLAGSERGFSDGQNAKFDTPEGLALLKDGSLLVADTGNRRIRRIEPNGVVSTIAGNGEPDIKDGLPLQASFYAPTDVKVDAFGVIYVADENSIRVLNRRAVPMVETLTQIKRGFADGNLANAEFNHISSLAIDENGTLFVADSENQVVRTIFGKGNALGKEITAEKIEEMRLKTDEMRKLGAARWCYNPPDSRRDIAGTFGEVRGEIKDGEQAHFHNGLDVAGNYGETARFVRTEKVLRPLAVNEFNGKRENLRLPTMGYIHLRLGRDSNNKPFDDSRFQFEVDKDKKIEGLRISRGTKFKAGEAIGTLNSMNHIHLISGRSGAEMNALDALILPNAADTIAPTVEKVLLFDESWKPLGETKSNSERIKIAGKIRVVVRAYDRMDGNPERRRLGVYSLGYGVFAENQQAPEFPEMLRFSRLPDEKNIGLIYAKGSQSGYTPDTIMDFIVTNSLANGIATEGFLETARFANGNYTIQVFVADFMGNKTTKEIQVKIEN